MKLGRNARFFGYEYLIFDRKQRRKKRTGQVELTRPQTYNSCRTVSVSRAALPQLPIAVVAPAVDRAASQQSARMKASRSERNNSCLMEGKITCIRITGPVAITQKVNVAVMDED